MVKKIADADIEDGSAEVDAPAKTVRVLTQEEQKAIDRLPVNINKIAEDTKAILDKRPKVSIMLPLEPGEKKGAYDTARINGYRYQVLKGAMVMVPDCVAELFAEKYNIALNAGSEKRLDNVPEELS